MSIEFPRWDRSGTDELAALLAGEEWPFHAGGTPDRATVLDRVAAGYYDGAGVRTFWVVEDGVRVGLVRLYDLDDDTPMFDLRLRAAARGRGLGTAAVRWLTDEVFTEFPAVDRIEATTRADNRPMRRVLGANGYQREARYRQAWPVPGGPPLDSLGYAVLRADWAAGRGVSGPGPAAPVLELGAVIVDCADPGPVAAFWAAACAGEVVRTEDDSVWLEIGGMTVIFRAVADHRPPTWPSPDVPLQAHLDWWIDDLDAAEAELLRLGATRAPHQPHRADGAVILVDPAGHPFCIGTRL